MSAKKKGKPAPAAKASAKAEAIPAPRSEGAAKVPPEPRNIIFVAPFLMLTTLRFVDGIRSLQNVRTLGIVQRKPEGIPAEDRAHFDDLIEVDDALSAEQLVAAGKEYERRYGRTFRVVNILEQSQIAVAKMRAAMRLPGLQPDAAERFLDKSAMKEAMRKLGIPCARSKKIASWDEGWAYVREIGFPVVLKPPIGAGCIGTYRANNDAEFLDALHKTAPTPENLVQVEEFLIADEFSFDTVAIDGRVLFHSISCYTDPCLRVMQEPWIQYTYVLPKDISGPEYDAIREVGVRAVEGLGMASGMTHCEWFRRKDGSVAIGEVAARPPGAQITRSMCHCYDANFYRIWARAIVDNVYEDPGPRKYAVGTAFLRGQGSGKVVAVHGVEEAHRRWGHMVAEATMPKIGQPKNEHYEGEGNVIIRGADTEAVKAAILGIVSTIRIEYG